MLQDIQQRGIVKANATILDSAIAHIRAGRAIFPGFPNSKIPALEKNIYASATTDEKQVLSWWKENPLYNICIPCGVEVSPGKYLLVVDFDVKKQNGFETKLFLEDMDMIFPDTLTQETAGGGEHMLYTLPYLPGNGVGFIGPGIDHRGFHGYIMGAGSWVNGKEYKFKNKKEILPAPGWIEEKLRPQSQARDLHSHSENLRDEKKAKRPINQDIATRRGRDYLDGLPVAPEGERNIQAFKAAAMLKDFGLDRQGAFDLMVTDWRHEPEIELEEISRTVRSAYAKGDVGSKAPEAFFEVIPPPKTSPKNPLEKINQQYAYITIGGQSRILWYTTDHEGKTKTETLTTQAFHDRLLNQPQMQVGNKFLQPSKEWMKWSGRKTFDGLVFEPSGCSDRFYNTWHGFTVKPWGDDVPSPTAVKAVEIFKEHIIKNVALGNMEHANWIFCWLAHLFQKPGVKPRTALVLRGGKGIGKSTIFNCISKLLGSHYLSVAHRRYLTGNFNGHLEGKILYVLEEAFWAKDKNAEGVLKDLVTSPTLQIERKGYESYPAKNLCRVVILGNEEWVVPTSEDERRYAVFDVASHNRNDEDFFAAFNEDMDHRCLYDFFMGFDLSLANIEQIPKTTALGRQKEHSQEPLARWWGSCMRQAVVGEIWPKEMPTKTLRDHFREEMRAQNFRGLLPEEVAIGRFLKKACPSLLNHLVRTGENTLRQYSFPSIDTARKEWCRYMGQDIAFDDDLE